MSPSLNPFSLFYWVIPIVDLVTKSRSFSSNSGHEEFRLNQLNFNEGLVFL